jgi:hypothetical protein
MAMQRKLMEKNPSIAVWNFSQKSNINGKIAGER